MHELEGLSAGQSPGRAEHLSPQPAVGQAYEGGVYAAGGGELCLQAHNVLLAASAASTLGLGMGLHPGQQVRMAAYQHRGRTSTGRGGKGGGACIQAEKGG